jgi:phage-related protein
MLRTVTWSNSPAVAEVTEGQASASLSGDGLSAQMRRPAGARPAAFNSWIRLHSTSRITLRRLIRSRACTTSFLSSMPKSPSTVRVASRGPGSIYSPRRRLASSTARMSVS